MPIIKSWSIALLCSVCALVLASGAATAGEVSSISLDFPYGELRLLVQRDGEAHLFYGALPSSPVLAAGTLDIDTLFAQVQPKLHPVVPTEEQPFGMVTISFTGGGSRDYLIYDGDFAATLLGAACRNRIATGDAAEAVLARACANLQERP